MSDIERLHFLYNRGYSDMSLLREILMRYKYEGTDFSPIIQFIYYCRSIRYGKGERDLSYRMIVTLFSIFPALGLDVLRHVILVAGGFNDVKRFCLMYSDCDEYEPLVSLAISLANSELRKNGYSKWIPRERGHKELFDKFVGDWFGKSFVTNGMRKEYRYILSDGRTNNVSKREGYFEFIGEYFRLGLKGSIYTNISRDWSCVLRSVGDCCSGCIPVVDIDIEIQKENLYHALGFACLIAQKSGAWRVLLISAKPIWVDLTPASGDFCSMVALLWDHCEIRTRSCFSIGLELVCSVPVCSSYGVPLRLVFFSETFDFDWNVWLPRIPCPIVLWNIGCRASFPLDFGDHKGVSFMSGFMPGLIGSIGVSRGVSVVSF